ncbi:MBL fold metallo-hydrolase, partial [Clostridium sp.]|uniref:MBL fold metallo-hydrolase n=1 Tax=Clostridium sp. TaxID=1506 RepID=UPI003463B30C
GDNLIFIINCDNVRLAHLGDLGHNLDTETIKLLSNINILCIPVGGNFTINGETAANICKKICTKIILPMHYNTLTNPSNISGVDKFILHMGNGRRHSSPYIDIEEYEKAINTVILPESIASRPLEI